MHKSSTCCPYLQCSKLHDTNKSPADRKKIQVIKSHLDNYEKTAMEIRQNANTFLRSSDDELADDFGACIVNGSVYKSGSAMSTSSLCSYCYCINGLQKCVTPKCSLPTPGCKPVYVDTACCPVRYDCSSKEPLKANITKTQNHIRRSGNKHYLRNVDKIPRLNGCMIDGSLYPEGQKLPSDNSCELCFCLKGEKKCTRKKCAPIIRGCTPKVPRGECCAVGYDCSK